MLYIDNIIVYEPRNSKDYLFQKISKAKNDFDNKYKKLIEISSENNDSEYKSKNIYEDDFNYHEEKNIISQDMVFQQYPFFPLPAFSLSTICG